MKLFKPKAPKHEHVWTIVDSKPVKTIPYVPQTTEKEAEELVGEWTTRLLMRCSCGDVKTKEIPGNWPDLGKV